MKNYSQIPEPNAKKCRVVNKRWFAYREYDIGKGAYGTVHYGCDSKMQLEVAIKFEEIRENKRIGVDLEYEILEQLQDVPGFPKVYDLTEYKKFKVLVSDLLGPSIDRVVKHVCSGMSIDNVCYIGAQAVKRLFSLHSIGYVHRDIKPNNFLLGKLGSDLPQKGLTDFTVYLIDFGLSCKYIVNGRHYSEAKGNFVGTPRYSSPNTHFKKQQGRRDDLMSLFYVLVFLHDGYLPWQGVKAKDKAEKKQKIGKCKVETSIKELCKNMPGAFIEVMEAVFSLEFKEEPPYEAIIERLLECMKENSRDSFKLRWFKEIYSSPLDVMQDKWEKYMGKNPIVSLADLKEAIPYFDKTDYMSFL